MTAVAARIPSKPPKSPRKTKLRPTAAVKSRSCFSRAYWTRHRAAQQIRAYRRLRDQARARGGGTSVAFYAFCARVEVDKVLWAGASR